MSEPAEAEDGREGAGGSDMPFDPPAERQDLRHTRPRELANGDWEWWVWERGGPEWRLDRIVTPAQRAESAKRVGTPTARDTARARELAEEMGW